MVPAQTGRTRSPLGNPYDWVNDPPAVRPVDFSAVTFGNPAFRNTLQRWEDAASRMHAEGWFHRTWYGEPGNGHCAIQWWSTTPQYVSPNGGIEGGAPSKSGEVHLIRIGHVPSTSPEQPEFVTLDADWMPSGKGWGVHCSASEPGQG